MNFKKTVGVALFAFSTLLASLAAHSETVPLVSGLNEGTETFDDISGYTDYLTFSITASSSITAFFDLNTPGSFFDLDALTVSLFKVGSPDALLASSGSTTAYNYASNLGAGDYYFSISGTPTGIAGGQYNYSINIVATPVPEANKAMMMLMGAMLLTMVSVRRSRLNA